MNETWIILIAAAGSFIAGFVDAVVGGGGLLQVPLLFILFPNTIHTSIIATNRFASFAGTVVAVFGYLKKIRINKKAIFFACAFATVASFGGVFIMQQLSTAVFKPMLLLILVGLLLYTIFFGQMGIVGKEKFKGKSLWLAFSLIGLILGLYNGVIGPGTGTLLVFALVQFVGLNFLQASANAKIINAVADGASLIAFLFQKVIMFQVAIPMMLTNMLGAYIGSKLALKKGNHFIRIFFILMLMLLIGRFAWDIFKN
jgi:uncharacterized membrane protein YfcA